MQGIELSRHSIQHSSIRIYMTRKKATWRNLWPSNNTPRSVDHHTALEDLRTLIKLYGGNGAWIWDPFLRADDILATLFFCKSAGVSLKGPSDQRMRLTKKIYRNIVADLEENNKEDMMPNNTQYPTDPADVINAERVILNNPMHINTGLNLEFRMQHGNFGWKFHDRFLIFPGEKQVKSRVYALGTSVNSFGKEHNILQLVSHPQPVADAFNELWDELSDHPECIVHSRKFPV